MSDLITQRTNDPQRARALILDALRVEPQTQGGLCGALFELVTWNAFQTAFIEMALDGDIVPSHRDPSYTDVWMPAIDAGDLTARPRLHDVAEDTPVLHGGVA